MNNRKNAALTQLNSLFQTAKIIDLSVLLEKGIPRWPTHAPLIIDPTATHEHDGYACQTISIAEHTGTHVDAPFHIHSSLSEFTIEKLKPDAFMGPCTVIDLSFKEWKPGERATLSDIQFALDQTQTQIDEGDIVLVNYGWMRYWTTSKDWGFYANNQPGFTEDVASFLMEKKVKAVGTDTAAVGTPVINGNSEYCYFHQVVLREHIHLIECLDNLQLLPPKCFFIALPLKIAKGTGSPVRAIAVILD